MKKLMMLLCLAAVSSVYAQETRVAGRVTEMFSSKPIPGVLIMLKSSADTSITHHTYTDVTGSFGIAGVNPGTFTISFIHLEHKRIDAEIEVKQERDTRVDRSMEEEPILMQEVTTQTTSRKAERVQDAPAGISVIQSADIALRPGLTPADHLSGVPGIDIVQKGIVQRDFVARGLNNVFNGTTLALTDYRIAGLPSLRANVSYLMPQTDDDIETIEVVRGPASAVYGPNVTNGVLNIITKSPFASRGTSMSLAGGGHNLFHGVVRHAAILNETFGFKLSGQYFRADDWEFTDPGNTSPRDKRLERFSGEMRLDYLFGEAYANVTGGFSQAVRTIDLTDNGPAQARNFRYYYVQGRVTMGDLFVQGYVNQNNAGETFILGTRQQVIDDSKKYVGEIQHSSRLGDMQQFTYGANVYLTRPDTKGTIFGRNEGGDNIDEYGLYLQSETRIAPGMLRATLAGRIDWHSRLSDPVVSPRAGLVLTPWENQSLRFTYNRAYATPAPSDYFLDLLVTDDVFGFAQAGLGDFRYGLRGTGVPSSGYTFERLPGVGLTFASTFNPGERIPVAGAGAYWNTVADIVVQSVQNPVEQQLLQQLFAVVPPPTPEQVGGATMALNLETGSFDPVTNVRDVPPLKPMINQTFEVGYKGVLEDRLDVGLDVFYSKVKDFVTSQQVFTPNVFLNGEQVAVYLYPYLLGAGISQDSAQAIAQAVAAAMGGIPLGTVSPKQAANPTEVLLSPTNAGNIEYWGIDLSTSYAISSTWSLGGSYSFLSKNYFSNLGLFGDLSLNAPKHKGSLSVRYRHLSSGITGEIRYRFVDGFRVKSAVYQGTINPYGLVDLSVIFPLSHTQGLTLTLAGTNLLNHKHQEFIGAPQIGRLVIGRLSWSM